MRLLLNYHDAILYESDLQILQSSTGWLNDACIHFGMTRLQQQFSPPTTAAATTYHDDANDDDDDMPSASTHTHHDDDADKDNTPSSSSSSLPFLFYFVDPAVVSFVMHQCTDDEEIHDLVVNGDPLLWKAKYIFLPINDGHAPSACWWHPQQRGTHWSLLLVIDTNAQCQQDNDRRTNDNNKVDNDNNDDVTASWSFLHFDSIQGSRNAQTARVVAAKFHRILLLSSSSALSSQDDDAIASSSRSSSSVTARHHCPMTVAVPKVIECDTPQQLNGYDCGLHVLASVEVLATRASASVAAAATCNSSSTASTSTTTVGATNEMTSLQPFPHDHMTRLRSTLANEAIRLSGE